MEALPAIGQHDQAGVLVQGRAGRVSDPSGHDAGFGPVDLVQQQEGVHPAGHREDAGRQVALEVVGRRRPVLGVEPVQFAGRLARLDHHRFAVDRRASRGRGEEVRQDHAGPGRQRPAQLVALAVVAAEADGVDLADPERDQVIEDRPGRARLAADLHDVVDRQARLDRRLVPGRVDVQVTVEEEVAHDPDAQLRVPAGDGEESFGVHRLASRR